eukprot:2244578-Rhodomonas_salina.4
MRERACVQVCVTASFTYCSELARALGIVLPPPLLLFVPYDLVVPHPASLPHIAQHMTAPHGVSVPGFAQPGKYQVLSQYREHSYNHTLRQPHITGSTLRYFSTGHRIAQA